MHIALEPSDNDKKYQCYIFFHQSSISLLMIINEWRSQPTKKTRFKKVYTFAILKSQFNLSTRETFTLSKCDNCNTIITFGKLWWIFSRIQA